MDGAARSSQGSVRIAAFGAASTFARSRLCRAALVLALAAASLAPTSARAAPAAAPESSRALPWEIFVGLGFGDAVCDNEKPDSDCPVDGAFALTLGGGWRFHKRFSLGGELSLWAFKIRDEWAGGLNAPATEVSFTSVYLAPYVRWYWFDRWGAEPYLQAGVGLGSVQAKAANDAGTYTYTATGVAVPLAVGMEWRIGKRFRLGPQAQAYLQISNQICADEPDTDKECHSPGRNEDGDREGMVLPWRIMLMGSVVL
jgi:hypothetical protein